MDSFLSLKRTSQSAKTDCKRLKCVGSQKDVLTTDASTQEVKLLTKFKFVVENKTVPPGSMEENERIDPDIERNMYGIQERLVMVMDVCREIEGMTREEDEILSRIS